MEAFGFKAGRIRTGFGVAGLHAAKSSRGFCNALAVQAHGAA